MIDKETKRALREVFEKLENPVKIKVYKAGEYSEEMEELIKNITEESEKIEYEVLESKKGPYITFEGYENIQFWGLPVGFQFISIVEMILGISRRIDLGIDIIKNLNKEIELQLFVIPNCKVCPTMARNLLYLALMNPKIPLKIIEAYEFPELIERYNVNAVPKTVIIVEGKEEDSFEGVLDLENILFRVASAVE